VSSLRGRTLVITGASRGIGKAIGVRAARDGANVVVVAKTVEPHPKLPGTIHTAAREMREAGGEALAVQADIRFEEEVARAVERAVAAFGGIDILVNNASAIFLAGTRETPMKRFDLMHQVNVRGTVLTSRLCLPHLVARPNPHILNLAPPIPREPRWWAAHLGYTLAKVGMSHCVLGMAEELRGEGVAVNALWPRTTIATAAVRNLLGGEEMVRRSRRPEIVADAAHAILVRDARSCTGNFFLDEVVLAEEGVDDFTRYAVDPGAELQPDLFLDPGDG
jgi:citronellol/citronellal dehydrogenase